MSDHDTDETPASDGHDHHDSDTPEPRPDHRTTAPQSPYSNRDVGVGFVVALVGMVVVFGLPVLLTL